jgi:DNA-binding PadR family transcriptional regulator
MPRKSLSELECFVLGLVWQIGPCSAYELRRHMQGSPSTQWSGSAGAVYPLVQRLERQKLLKGQSRRTGRRARREFSITTAGLARLRAWVGPPFAPEVVTVTYDPLRARARFLGTLPPNRRKAWVRGARLVLDGVEKKLRHWHARYDTALSEAARMMARSAELELRARREWIELLA